MSRASRSNSAASCTSGLRCAKPPQVSRTVAVWLRSIRLRRANPTAIRSASGRPRASAQITAAKSCTLCCSTTSPGVSRRCAPDLARCRPWPPIGAKGPWAVEDRAPTPPPPAPPRPGDAERTAPERGSGLGISRVLLGRAPRRAAPRGSGAPAYPRSHTGGGRAALEAPMFAVLSWPGRPLQSETAFPARHPAAV
jgi:hypothetical protein